MSTPIGRRSALLLAGLTLVVQVVLVYAPSGAGAPAIPHLDKVVHATIFALPVYFGLRARLPWWPVIVAMALHAPVSEFLQAAVLPRRTGDPWDALADLLGVGIGALLAARAQLRGRDATDSLVV